MDIVSIFLIAIGLSMDAFAVSVTSGMVVDNIKFSYGLIIASSFGFFQALMPVAGWFAGRSFINVIEPVDHWIAFLLLLFIGLRMIILSIKKNENEKIDKLSFKTLFFLSVATSIDALAVGLSLSFVKINIFLPAVIIGSVTFLISMTGMFIGKHTGSLLGNRAEFLGGVILLFIGFRILFSHLS